MMRGRKLSYGSAFRLFSSVVMPPSTEVLACAPCSKLRLDMQILPNTYAAFTVAET